MAAITLTMDDDQRDGRICTADTMGIKSSPVDNFFSAQTNENLPRSEK